ncbi:MAG: formylmethanofuran dehydrogenase subunit E family protein [Candidatus Omnitrophica bacterium]|nr:formylmethanofuran dehydrogenase subunit E family protein [Candidatus Omnitrophota bacterium]
MKESITLREAVRFHGHLGPYLVLGLAAGRLALNNLKAKKYFGLEVKVYGASLKPKSCLIDGLQLATGATYGKGNIHKFNGPEIKIEFSNKANNSRMTLKLKKQVIEKLGKAKTHEDSELLARELYQTDSSCIFNLRTRYLVLGTREKF